jgi:hypothetical protein
MDIPGQSLLFLGIIPALILLYISLKGYEGYYKDKIIFLTFIIGIIFGVIAAIIRLVINPPIFLIIYLFLFAFFEQLFKTIVLNIGRFQVKKETTIYGLSLGLGFGSSFTPFLVIAGSQISNDLTFISLVAFGSIGFILFHSATSAYIGYGIYTGKMIKYLIIAVILQLPFNTIADATRDYQNPYLEYFQIALVIYGVVLFVYMLKKIMPLILKDDKRKRSKKN